LILWVSFALYRAYEGTEFADHEADEEESADDEEEDDTDNGHNSLQSRLIHVLQEPPPARTATASFQLVMTGRALGSVEHPDCGAYEAEKSTEVYDFRTDTWTDSSDLCGDLRLAKNSSRMEVYKLVG
jgi:hypothetical protein